MCKKKIVFIIVVVVAVQMLTSCLLKGGFDLNSVEFNENKNILEIVTTVYDESQLNDISSLRCTINELNNRFPVECIRKDFNHYRVSYAGKNMFVVIHFDEDGKWLMTHTYKANLSLSDYKTIKKGQTLAEVIEIDPEGDYIFLYTGRNDCPISTHISVDGYLIQIIFDSNIVDEILIELL